MALQPYRMTQVNPSDPDLRPIALRVRVRVPKVYHREPVISKLIADYGLSVTIFAALLGANGKEDGWFDLILGGTPSQVQEGLLYLNDLNLEIWYDSDEVDGW
jgi:hypothetical protein